MASNYYFNNYNTQIWHHNCYQTDCKSRESNRNVGAWDHGDCIDSSILNSLIIPQKIHELTESQGTTKRHAGICLRDFKMQTPLLSCKGRLKDCKFGVSNFMTVILFLSFQAQSRIPLVITVNIIFSWKG